jgi:hypothetical protein
VTGTLKVKCKQMHLLWDWPGIQCAVLTPCVLLMFPPCTWRMGRHIVLTQRKSCYWIMKVAHRTRR